MSLDAQIIAIGPYSKRIVDSLEYPESDYASVPEGATVVSNVFVALNSDESNALADGFGVGPMELGRHALDLKSVDLRILEEIFGDETVRNFTLLREAGFKFYFLPNA